MPLRSDASYGPPMGPITSVRAPTGAASKQFHRNDVERYLGIVELVEQSAYCEVGHLGARGWLTAAIPTHWTDPLHGRTNSAIFGYPDSNLDTAASRTSYLIDRFRWMRPGAGDARRSAKPPRSGVSTGSGWRQG